MLDHSIRVLEKHYIRIDKQFDKLITALRTATTTTSNTKYDRWLVVTRIYAIATK